MANRLANFFTMSEEREDKTPTLYVLLTPSAHVPFIGSLERTVSAAFKAEGGFDPKTANKVLVCVEERARHGCEPDDLMNTAFQIAGDFCIFNAIERPRYAPEGFSSERVTARVALQFGNLIATLKDSPNDRVLALVADADLASELEAFPRECNFSSKKFKVLDVSKLAALRATRGAEPLRVEEPPEAAGPAKAGPATPA